MEPVRLATATLSQVDDTFYFGGRCQSCQKDHRISLERLRATLGDDFLVCDIRPRLKCSRCGSRDIVTGFLRPEQRIGSLAAMFDRPFEQEP